MNRRVDDLIGRVARAVQPSKPIGREIPFFASIETRFENLPQTFDSTCGTHSDILTGNNVKRGIFTNGGSRVYVREIGFRPVYVIPTTVTGTPVLQYDARLSSGGLLPPNVTVFGINWRWNFMSSITQRWYSDRRVLAQAGGRPKAGNHLAFREPLIIEPMETFTFECELLSFGMLLDVAASDGITVVSMLLSGYREGI